MSSSGPTNGCLCAAIIYFFLSRVEECLSDKVYYPVYDSKYN